MHATVLMLTHVDYISDIIIAGMLTHVNYISDIIIAGMLTHVNYISDIIIAGMLAPHVDESFVFQFGSVLLKGL